MKLLEWKPLVKKEKLKRLMIVFQWILQSYIDK